MFICNFALQISFLVSVFNKGEIGCLLFIDQSVSSEEISDGFSPVPPCGLGLRTPNKMVPPLSLQRSK